MLYIHGCLISAMEGTFSAQFQTTSHNFETTPPVLYNLVVKKDKAMTAAPPPPQGPPLTTINENNGHEAPLESETQITAGPVITRAGVAAQPRLVLMTSIGALWGFAIGSYLGGKQTSFQYLAENAHRLPTTVQGWYFYHKTKNYKVILGGIKRGARMAIPTGAICLAYGAIEAGLDDVRKEADVFNSVMAGMGTGVLFSAMSKFLSNFLSNKKHILTQFPSFKQQNCLEIA